MSMHVVYNKKDARNKLKMYHHILLNTTGQTFRQYFNKYTLKLKCINLVMIPIKNKTKMQL